MRYDFWERGQADLAYVIVERLPTNVLFPIEPEFHMNVSHYIIYD